MATTVTLNGTSYSIPAVREARTWGKSLSDYLIAISTTVLQKNGGSFTLTADANFGGSKGLIAVYYKSYTANLAGTIATTGVIRLGNLEAIVWRNAANNADIELKANATNDLEYGGVKVPTISSTDTLSNKTLTTPVIGSITPVSGVTSVSGTGAVGLPVGTTAQRPTPASGQVRLNSETGEFEGYSSSAWQSIGGGVNERPAKNYYKPYAQSTIAPGTLSTLATTTSNIAISGSAYAATSAFYADSTSGASALSQDTSSAIRGTNSYLSALSGANTNGSVFFQLPAFCLDAADIGKPTTIAFDLSSALADGDYDIVVVRYTVSGATGTHASILPVQGNASSASVTPSAKLGTGTAARFQGFFIPDSTTATDVYAVRVRRLVGSVQIKFDSLYCGPDSVVQGAGISDAKEATLTIGATTTPPTKGTNTTSYTYCQNGEFMELTLIYSQTVAGSAGTGTYLFTLPDSLQVNTTKLPSGFIFGNGYVYDGTNERNAKIYFSSSTTQFRILVETSATAFAEVGSTAGALSNATIKYHITAKIPIVGWSSNVTMMSAPTFEYASNSGTATAADDTTNFAYGLSGNLIGSITAIVERTVKFQGTGQSTDQYILEIRNPGANQGWIKSTDGVGGINVNLSYQNGTSYGMGIMSIDYSTCKVVVRFGTYAWNHTTYGTAGTAWSAALGTYYWRVRRIVGVGAGAMPISARNIVGDTSGNAVPAGLIGERQTNTSSGATGLTSGQYSDGGNAGLTLQPGIWLVKAHASISWGSASALTLTYIGIGTASGNSATGADPLDYIQISSTSRTPGAITDLISSSGSYQNIPVATTFYPKTYITATVGTATTSNRVSAVRIA